MSTVSLAGGWQLNDTWSIRTGVGLILDGDLQPDNASAYVVQAGGVVALGVEYLFQRGTGSVPSLDYSLFVSASSAETEHPITGDMIKYASADVRLGGRATWNINNKIFPFFAGRVFGGPVSWNLNDTDVLGSDVHHYQFALGTAIQFGSVGTFVEWAGVGEKALSAGLSYRL